MWWGDVAGELAVSGPVDAHEDVMRASATTLLLTMTRNPHPVIKRLRSGPEVSIVHPGYLVDLVAAGDTLTTISPRGNQGLDKFALTITPRAIDRLAVSSRPPRRDVTSAINIDHPLIREIARALADELMTEHRRNLLYGETLARAITMEILREYGIETTRGRPAPGALAPWQLRRATRYMHDHLKENVAVADLARLVNLSKSRFGRAFKASTGMAPHQWLLNARVRRAQALLQEEKLPLSEVALVTGFSEQSHFTRIFRRTVGVSPGAWQRQGRE
jgi:AraC-like DNA-binding protein